MIKSHINIDLIRMHILENTLTAMPFVSLPTLAAVADVFGTVVVEVSDT